MGRSRGSTSSRGRSERRGRGQHIESGRGGPRATNELLPVTGHASSVDQLQLVDRQRLSHSTSGRSENEVLWPLIMEDEEEELLLSVADPES